MGLWLLWGGCIDWDSGWFREAVDFKDKDDSEDAMGPGGSSPLWSHSHRPGFTDSTWMVSLILKATARGLSAFLPILQLSSLRLPG